MVSRIVALFIALFLAVPALAAAGAGAPIASPAALSFEAGETSADASQHEPPGTTDEQPLEEQAGQTWSEGATDSPALMMARPDAKAPLLTMARPRPYAMAAWRAPYLDGPQRPPCEALVSA